jgi:16S rRNA (uracil1498-N3)-methyltransferase
MPRFYTPQPLATGTELALDAASARHVQVLRMQPGGTLTLFNGQGGEYAAEVTHMGRSEVRVRVGLHSSAEREAARAVHIVIGMPANERMEWLVEKATELGVASIQPLMTERTVLRLSGERAEKKQAHWQAIAVAACEQSGRNRVPVVHAVQNFNHWLAAQTSSKLAPALGKDAADSDDTALRRADYTAPRCVFSVHHASLSARAFAAQPTRAIDCLCGPEGGLSPTEEAAAIASGYAPVSLGPRVLRSETAPLAALALWAL